MTVSLKYFFLLVKIFYKNNDCAPLALQKFRTLKGVKKGAVRWLPWVWWKLFRNSKRLILLMRNLVDGGKESIRRQPEKWPQQWIKSRVVVWNRSAHRKLPDHWTDLWVRSIKFNEIFCIPIHQKLAMGRNCFRQICQQEAFALEFLARMKWRLNGCGKLCEQTKYISIWKDMPVHRIDDYRLQKIRSQIIQFYWFLQRFCVVQIYGIISLRSLIFSKRWIFLVLLPVTSLVRAMITFWTTSPFQLYYSVDVIIFTQDYTPPHIANPEAEMAFQKC